MQVYQDITLIPDAETNLGFLWKKVYTQVHLALVEANQSNRQHGVAFPEYCNSEFPLGSKLRVFANNEEELKALHLVQWLKRLQDYCHITSIKPVPKKHGHVYYRRKQFKSNPERLARRRSKRHNEPFEIALKHYKGFKEPKTKLPFISLPSLSTEGNHEFPLYIEQTEANEPKTGRFNCYGLSNVATVPRF